ncbi:hypothetical protein S140_91 [Shewanella sp. phage 1/40]|uniref:hypothetical protein n=1 Tax=Shewanella sp. phage 1/40 TaxID=1458860 RepID=UPI0004F7D891|nr:hypothetical protein S140_91 [Shewanella sp. phage 1/40]AHK11498.1 hypothetical protein S140_91 [Shewanella sp. phage 1/40]
MNNNFTNGCVEQATMDCYAKLHGINLIHSYSMHIDEHTEEECVMFGFNLHGDEYHAIVDPQTMLTTLYIEFDMKVGDGKVESTTDFYGHAELDDLLVMLKKVPTVMDVLVDYGDGRLH